MLFGGLPGVQIGCRIARRKGLWVEFPTQLEFFNLEFICLVKNQISQDWSKCAKWGCLKAECCCSQLLNAFLNSKLSSWYLIGNIFVSSYYLTHQESHLANQARRKLDFPKVTSEVSLILLRQRYSWHLSQTMTLVQKVKEVFLPWHVLDRNLSQFPKLHLLFL